MFNRLFSAFLRNHREDYPGERSGHKATKAGPYIIIFGGYNNVENHRVYTELWFYHIYFKKWHRFLFPSNFTKATLSSSILFHKGKIYIFGGTGFPFAQECTNYITVFDIEQHTWHITGEDSTSYNYQPNKKYCQSMVFYEDKLYVFGGTTGFVENNDLNVFDLIEEKWIPVNPAPSGLEPLKCFRHEAVVFNHKMYIIGGAVVSSDRLYSFVDIRSFDLKTHAWEGILTNGDKQFNHPTSRTCFAITQHEELLFVSGGKGIDGTVFDDVWKLNLLTMTWVKLCVNLLCPIYFHSMVYGCDDRLYVFGGIKDDYNTRSNTLQVITHRVQQLMHIVAEVVGSNKQFEEFVSDHTLTQYRPCQPYELCFQKVI